MAANALRTHEVKGLRTARENFYPSANVRTSRGTYTVKSAVPFAAVSTRTSRITQSHSEDPCQQRVQARAVASVSRHRGLSPSQRSKTRNIL